MLYQTQLSKEIDPAREVRYSRIYLMLTPREKSDAENE